jgi:hypothetical protein
MSWLYVPASEASNSDSNLPSQPLAQSVTWRGKPIRSLSHSPVFAMVFLTMHQSGLTSKPSTASRGVALWIASLAAIPVSPSPTRAVEKGRTIPDTSGPISGESSLKSNHDSVSLKTWLDTFHLVLNQYGETFAIWVTRLKLDSLRRLKLALHISGSGSSSWRTPTDDSRRGGAANPLDRILQGHTVNLQDQASYWPTPNVPNGGRTMTPEDISNKGATAKGKRQVGLENVARQWPTPRTSDQNGPGQHGEGGPDLRTEADMWGTPTARDHKDGFNPSIKEPTNYRLGLQAPRTPMPGQKFYASKRALNPRFVEWLMGFPIGWTDLQPLATLSFQQWRQQHGDNLERRQ